MTLETENNRLIEVVKREMQNVKIVIRTPKICQRTKKKIDKDEKWNKNLDQAKALRSQSPLFVLFQTLRPLLFSLLPSLSSTPSSIATYSPTLDQSADSETPSARPPAASATVARPASSTASSSPCQDQLSAGTIAQLPWWLRPTDRCSSSSDSGNTLAGW